MVTPTSRNGFELQSQNSNIDNWGVDHLNPTIQLIDDSLDGLTTVNITGGGTFTLPITNYTTSSGRMRMIRITGVSTGASIVVPAVQKWWIVLNDTTGTGTISFGSVSQDTTIQRKGMQIISQNPAATPAFTIMSPLGYVDSVFYKTPSSFSVEVDDKIKGRYVIVDRSTVDNILVNITETDGLPNSGQLCLDSSLAGLKNIQVSGLYDFDGITPVTVNMYVPAAWIRLVEANPGKMSVSGGYGYVFL